MRVEFLAADTGHKTEAWLRQEQRQESSEDHGGLGSRPLFSYVPATTLLTGCFATAAIIHVDQSHLYIVHRFLAD